jgi:quercetin dioxygenase-like cupin family protein
VTPAPRDVSEFDSSGVQWRDWAVNDFELMRCGDMRIAAGGRVGRHGAELDQLFVVVSGNGYAMDAAGQRVELDSGTSVLWVSGEEHETVATEDLHAIILQGKFVRRF